jgi:nucleoside-diphosphate-sugar epimerase
MNVFVAGATGVIGRRTLPLLLAAGHRVTGMTRRADGARLLSATGATPAVCDVYDRARLTDTLAASSSEVVIHLLTDLPRRFRPRAKTSSTDHLRRTGTRNLIAAARAAGVRRVIAESIAFLYRPGGRSPKTEADPPWLDAPGAFRPTVAAAVELERQVLGAPSLDGLVLRFGWLYGPGTWYAVDGSIGRDVRRRRYPIVGDGRGTWSFVHVDDAACAVLAAVHRGEPGVYNVVDDEPATMNEWLPAFADAIGAPRPYRVPTWLARIVAGRAAAEFSTRLASATNAKARAELGWAPRHRTWFTAGGAEA